MSTKHGSIIMILIQRGMVKQNTGALTQVDSAVEHTQFVLKLSSDLVNNYFMSVNFDASINACLPYDLDI